jgi:hypothetical protein
MNKLGTYMLSEVIDYLHIYDILILRTVNSALLHKLDSCLPIYLASLRRLNKEISKVSRYSMLDMPHGEDDKLATLLSVVGKQIQTPNPAYIRFT